MSEELVSALVVPIVWLLKSVAYWVIFRFRMIRATALDCLIIAGSPLLLSIILLPLPPFISFPASIGLAVYLTMHYTSVPLIPDGLFVPLGVEVTFRGALWLIQELGILT